MAWKNIPEKKVLATLKDGKDFKGTAAEKMTIYVDGGVPGGDSDVAGLTMTVDPNTYVMTTQLKDKNGGNVGSPATVDLPLESMVVSGEYDEDTKSIILTLKNGQTVEFSVADLVSGLQTEITNENPLNADLIDDASSSQKLVTEGEKQALEEIVNNGSSMYATMVGGDGYAELNNDNDCHLSMMALQNDGLEPFGVDMNVGGIGVHLANGTSASISQFSDSVVTSNMLDAGTYSYEPGNGVSFYVDENQLYGIADAGTIIVGPFGGNEGELRTIYFIPADGSHPITYSYNTIEGTVDEINVVNSEDLQAALDDKQDLIDSSNKLSADFIAETSNNKVMTATERTKLAGIAAGAEVNVQSDWNQTNSSADDYIKNKPTIPSKVSDLTNDAGYQNASQVSSAIVSAVGDITSFEYQVVQTLPQTGEKGVIYLVSNSGTTPNTYDEYIWVNNAFEKIGTTDIDLSNYVTNDDLQDYTASTLFVSENGIEISDGEGDSMGLSIEEDATTGNPFLTVTGPDGSFNVPNADDVANALVGKVDAIDPANLPSGAEQGGIIYVTDHTDIDPDSISNGQIVFDQNDGKLYIAEVTVDSETGENVVTWHEIQTKNEVVYIPITITSAQDMTFSTTETPAQIAALMDAGKKVMYRMTLPVRVGSIAAGVYDFTAQYHFENGSQTEVVGVMTGFITGVTVGVLGHVGSIGQIYMYSIQEKLTSSSKLSSDLISYDASNTNKLYTSGLVAPSSSQAGIVGEIYVDGNTGKVYVCTSTAGGTYTWVEVGSGTQVQSDWNQTNSSAVDFIKNKPTIPAAQVNSDWNASSGVARILNKPSLATVATTGAYSDLTGTPTIPTVNNATLTIQKNGSTVQTFTANASSNKTANIEVPVITMQTTDPGEGASLAANNFIAVYEA